MEKLRFGGLQKRTDEKRVNVVKNIRQMVNSPLLLHSFNFTSPNSKTTTAIFDSLFNDFRHRFFHQNLLACRRADHRVGSCFHELNEIRIDNEFLVVKSCYFDHFVRPALG